MGSSYARRTNCLLAMLLLASAFGACGDNDDPGDAAQVAAKKTFQSRTESVCKPTPRLADEDAGTAALTKVGQVRKASAERLDDLRRLGALERDRELLQEYFQAIEQLVRGPLLPAGEFADTEIIPANGRPARAPGLARDLAIAVNDGLVRLHKDRFVLTSAGRQQLARSGSQASARARRVAAKA